MDEKVDKFMEDIQPAIWILIPATFLLVMLLDILFRGFMSHLDIKYFNEYIILQGMFATIPFALMSIGGYILFYSSKKPFKYNYLFTYIAIVPLVLSFIEYSFAIHESDISLSAREIAQKVGCGKDLVYSVLSGTT